MDFVRVLNKGTAPIKIPFHANNFVIDPNGDKIVPWDAVASMLGDPNVKNQHKNPVRTKTYELVRAGLNFYNGFESEEVWEKKKPPLEVYDADSGSRIYMLFEDPEGERGGHDVNYDSPEMKIQKLEQAVKESNSRSEQLMKMFTAALKAQGIDLADSDPTLSAMPSVSETSLADLPPLSTQGMSDFPAPSDSTKATRDESVIISV